MFYFTNVCSSENGFIVFPKLQFIFASHHGRGWFLHFLLLSVKAYDFATYLTKYLHFILLKVNFVCRALDVLEGNIKHMGETAN